MYERILVPLDGSKLAEAILPNVKDMVNKISPRMQVEIILLEVISGIKSDDLTRDRRSQSSLKQNEMEKVIKEAEEYLETAAASLRSDRIKVKTVVAAGPVVEEIIKTAGETGANLIAMSTHGFSGLRKWALGSITEKILQASEIPILVIRTK